MTSDGVLRVASLDDLLALKLKVIFQRVEAKDYRDIAAMLGVGMRLEPALAAGCALFGTSFAPAEALKALVHFKGGDLQELTIEEKQRLVAAASSVRSLPQMSIRSLSLA
jgi:hypothetical protein